MKITAPHLGNVYIAAQALFDGLGIEYIVPPMNNKEALEMGSLFSPEEMCLPYKIMIGNYIQAIEKGADTVLLPGSCGPCRFGKYAEMQMNLFKKIGKEIGFIVIDSPGDIGIKELFKRINRISRNSKRGKIGQFESLLKAVKIMNILDEIEEKAHYLAGYEVTSGEFKRLLNSCKREALNTNNPGDMIRVLEGYKRKLDNVKIDKGRNPIKIAIIGEIYTIIEPFSNLFVEDKLMDYGVVTKRRLTPSWWVKDTLLKPTKLNSLKLKRNAKEYLALGIGGHGRECIGEAVLAHREGFDGAIQIFPLGCMPEIVSKSILPTISKERDFPIMSLVVDEMTGEAGFVTRVEAFVDLLERRRKNVLSRS